MVSGARPYITQVRINFQLPCHSLSHSLYLYLFLSLNFPLTETQLFLSLSFNTHGAKSLSATKLSHPRCHVPPEPSIKLAQLKTLAISSKGGHLFLLFSFFYINSLLWALGLNRLPSIFIYQTPLKFYVTTDVDYILKVQLKFSLIECHFKFIGNFLLIFFF